MVTSTFTHATKHASPVRGAKVDDDEGCPDDAGSVHGEADVLALVECLRDLPGQDGVHGAHDDQQDGVGQPDEVGEANGLLAHQLVVGAVGIEGDGLGRRDEEPDEADDDLPSHQRAADDELRLRADELGPLGRALAGAEDAGDAVGLGEDGGVADGEAEPQPHLLGPAGHDGGLGDEEEGHGVAQEDAEEQHEAELPARGLDHGRVLVAQEEHSHEAGGQDAQGGEGHGHQCDGVGVVEVDLGDGDARAHVVAGHRAVGTLLAPATQAQGNPY